jgi:predicted alpha/beta hydrolase
MDLPVEAADGHRFVVRWHPACVRDGPVLLFLPALGVPADRYDRFAQALATQGVGVAVPDWRGLGSSSLRAGRDCDWGYPELVALDVRAARAALEARLAGVVPAIGGHSLGGQVAVLAAALEPERYSALVLVATGVPDARTFGASRAIGVRLFAGAIGPITRVCGYFPGKRLRWAGREAARLMRQWAGTVRSGRYDGVGIPAIEARMANLALPTLGVRFSNDWLASARSLDALIGKLGDGAHAIEVFDAARLGEVPDHFRWLRAPAALANVVASWLRAARIGNRFSAAVSP